MTLRCDISIVPYGDEDSKRGLFRLEISNLGVVEPGMFGHDICKYRVVLKEKVLDYFRKSISDPEWEEIDVDFVERHDRRDGAVSLVEKACRLMAERA